MQLFPPDYKEAFVSYRKGFGLGVLIGIIGWIIIGKSFWTLPIALGLIFGSIAFHLKLLKIRNTKSND